MNLSKRHVASASALDGLEDVGVLNPSLLGRSTGDYRDHGGISETLGNGSANLSFTIGFDGAVMLVLGGGQIAGVGVQRFQQSMQRALSHHRDVGLFDVFATNAG